MNPDTGRGSQCHSPARATAKVEPQHSMDTTSGDSGAASISDDTSYVTETSGEHDQKSCRRYACHCAFQPSALGQDVYRIISRTLKTIDRASKYNNKLCLRHIELTEKVVMEELSDLESESGSG